MKKVFFILLLLTCFSQIHGQTNYTTSFLNANKQSYSYIKESKSNRTFSLKAYLIACRQYKKSSNATFSPKFSVDLLDGTGIHLFSISNMDVIPNINVGARIKAGIKILL